MITRELKAELLLPEYKDMSPAEKAAHYNAKTVTVPRRVPLEDLHVYLFEQGLMDKIESRTSDNSSVPAQAAANRVWRLFGPYSRMTSIDVNKIPFSEGISAMESAGDVSTSQKEAILAMGSIAVHISAANSGLPASIRESDVIKAEAL